MPKCPIIDSLAHPLLPSPLSLEYEFCHFKVTFVHFSHLKRGPIHASPPLIWGFCTVVVFISSPHRFEVYGTKNLCRGLNPVFFTKRPGERLAGFFSGFKRHSPGKFDQARFYLQACVALLSKIAPEMNKYLDFTLHRHKHESILAAWWELEDCKLRMHIAYHPRGFLHNCKSWGLS